MQHILARTPHSRAYAQPLPAHRVVFALAAAVAAIGCRDTTSPVREEQRLAFRLLDAGAPAPPPLAAGPGYLEVSGVFPVVCANGQPTVGLGTDTTRPTELDVDILEAVTAPGCQGTSTREQRYVARLGLLAPGVYTVRVRHLWPANTRSEEHVISGQQVRVP